MKTITEEELEILLINMNLEETYDEYNQSMHPDDALKETYYYILSNLPDWIKEDTKIEWSEFYDDVKDYIVDWFDSVLAFNSLFY